jgi:hypothetical protein
MAQIHHPEPAAAVSSGPGHPAVGAPPSGEPNALFRPPCQLLAPERSPGLTACTARSNARAVNIAWVRNPAGPSAELFTFLVRNQHLEPVRMDS